MKCTIPEISWHNRDPVLSIDIQPICNEDFYRLASGGTDCHVLIWYLKIRDTGAVDVDIVSDLNRHQRAVNVVRWSPSGQFLATGDDDASIIIWNLKTDNIPLLEGETADKEIWVVNKVLRGHKEDVYDICWSPNGMKLISGSIDNTAILWDFNKGQNEHILTDHKGFVQGVTWDPKAHYIATLSSDRVCRIFDSTGRHIKARAYKGLLPVPESHILFNKEVKYFHDDTFKSYFRRLSFSPDGSLLIAPSGCIEVEDYKEARNATFIFTLDCLTQPAAVLPSPKQVTLAVRCCPVLFELHSEGPDPIISLPYRIVIAVATDSDVVLYDTQQLAPFAHLRKIHYTRITDLTWSADGLLLIASSTDGFCTLITFEPDELGVQYIKEDSEAEESLMDISGCEEIEKAELSKKKKENEPCEVKVKQPTILDRWTVRTPKRDTLDENNVPCSSTSEDLDKEKLNLGTNKSASENSAKKAGVIANNSKKVPKRIVPIKVADIQKSVQLCKNINKSKSSKDMKKSKTVICNNKIENGNKNSGENNTVEQEPSNCSKDDSSVKDLASEASPANKKTNITSRRKSIKHNADIKKNHTPNKNNPLLQFFQVGSVKKKPQNNISANNEYENTTEVIEILDDEVSTSIDKVESQDISEIHNEKTITNHNLVVKNESVHQKGEDIIEIVDSDSCTSENNVVDQSSINIEVSKKNRSTSEKPENGDTDNTAVKTNSTERENVETKEITSSEVSVLNAKKSSTEDNTHHAETSKALSSPSTLKTSKTLRRIPFVTLSSPKRKKKE